MEKKAWEDPKTIELQVKRTEFGGSDPKNIDGPYIQGSSGQKYWPSGS